MPKAGLTSPTLIGSAVALAVLLVTSAWMSQFRVMQQEWVFDQQLDLTLGWRVSRVETPVQIIDIDRESLAAVGPWPWRRDILAGLAGAALDAGAQAVAFDILFAYPDARSPGAMARLAARETANARLAEIARELPDSDQLLAKALEDRPVVIGFTFDPTGTPLQGKVPFLSRGNVDIGPLWSSVGTVAPIAELAAAAQGIGLMSLPGDDDGVIRRVALLASVAGVLQPGLSIEALRLSQDASGYLLTGWPPKLTVGDIDITLAKGGLLRLVPRLSTADRDTISAYRILADAANASQLKGAIVMIGASAPEIGGLRNSLLDPLTPSVKLHARALRQVMAGISPTRPAYAPILELLFGLAVTIAGIIAAQRLNPARGAAVMIVLGGLCIALSLFFAARDLLVDPTSPLLAGAASFLSASLAAFAMARRREASLRRRFEQHLSPSVVARIAANPDVLRLNGEMRQITALFSDIEGFSAISRTARPEELIATLDDYFEGVATIIIRHGGMIDKFVGDAVHAFFNMPLDLPDHVDKAVLCAQEIIRWTQEYQQTSLPERIGLGRTRIGLETGDAVVGDVGLATKLDYTAYGHAVNIASRLEDLNKQFGTAICVGPCAATVSSLPLRSLGLVELRGVGMLEVFTFDDCAQ